MIFHQNTKDSLAFGQERDLLIFDPNEYKSIINHPKTLHSDDINMLRIRKKLPKKFGLNDSPT